MESLCLGSKQLEMITRQTTNTSVAPAEACTDGPTDSLSNPHHELCCKGPVKSTGVNAPSWLASQPPFSSLHVTHPPDWPPPPR